MLQAKTAAQISEFQNEPSIVGVESTIFATAMNGRFSVSINILLSDETAGELEKAGYMVYRNTELSKTYITWAHLRRDE